jgi:hypothetical protein
MGARPNPTIQQPVLDVARLNDSGGAASSGGGHSRVPTDSTNFTFLSALTDLSGECGIPRRRTKSWDNNEQPRHTQQNRSNRAGSRGPVAAVEQSPGGSSLPVSILQPILSESEEAEPVAPPIAILASNLRKPAPMPLPTFLTSSASITEGMAIGEPSVQSQCILVPKSSSSVTEGMASHSQRAIELPSASLLPKAVRWRHGAEVSSSTNLVTFLSPDTTHESSQRNNAPLLDETMKQNNKQKHYKLKDVLQASHEPTDETDVIRSVEHEQRCDSTSLLLSINQALLPQISDDRVHDFQVDELSHRTGRNCRRRRESTVGSISDLIQKMMAANAISPQRLSQRSADTISGRSESFDPLQKTKCGRDQYCHDAKRKFSFDSVTSPEDVEKVNSSKEQNENGGKGVKKIFFLTRWKCGMKDNVLYLLEFWKPHRSDMWKMFTRTFWFLMFPSLAIATLLFYMFENPPTGRATDVSCVIDDKNATAICETPEEKSLAAASVSWWLLFFGCRQVVTLFIGKISELIVINFFVLRTRVFPRMLGTTLSLALAQSKGGPFMIISSGIFNLMLNCGDRKFARHWLYWQNWIGLMNEDNPSGNVTDHPFYRRLICISIGAGLALTIKRMIMGRFIGQRVVEQFHSDLSRLMKRLLVIQEIAALAMQMDKKTPACSIETMYAQPLKGGASDDTSEVSAEVIGQASTSDKKKEPGKCVKSRSAVQETISEVLDDWDDPELQENEKSLVTTTDILQFRRAIELISNEYPFSELFGPASTREECIDSSQKVFDRLAKNSEGVLDFQLICRIAELSDGTTDYNKVRTMVKIFCPTRQGKINKIDFLGSTDRVYKALRLLLANIKNSSKIDHAYERLVNLVFFVLCFLAVLVALGVDIFALILGLSGLSISFAFMMGTASSKYLEGILLILVRKPYDIGDRVCFLDATADVNNNGPPSGGWIVEKVDLFTTTVRLATTREYTTFANGSLAQSRIINLKRSDKANVFFYMKFTINSTKQQLQIFRHRIVRWLEEHPREWIKLNAFRCLRVETDMQYMEYILSLQHREPWQNYNSVQNSRSDFNMFALDLQKELKMEYTAPRMPIDLHGLCGDKDSPFSKRRNGFGDSRQFSRDSDENIQDYIHSAETKKIR